MDFSSSTAPKIQTPTTVETTLNQHGYMFLTPLDSFDYWTSSLPNSHLPLLDLGSAYGVNTLHAMRAGRDVIASDMEPKHLGVLRERAKELTQETHDKPIGRLIDTKVMTLPCSDGMEEKSVSGVLVSEVFHFLRPGEPEKILKDAYKWLDVCGILVVNCISYSIIDHPQTDILFQLDGGHSQEAVIEMMEEADEKAMTVTKKEMDRIPPIYLIRKDDTPMKIRESLSCDGNLLLHSIANLSIMAREAGFEIIKACYISPRRYPNYLKELGNETALLVARKPFTK